MTQAAESELDERVLGRRWTVRLDPAGRGSAAVCVSCSRPGCAAQRLPSAAAGRAAAVAHLKAHLEAGPAPLADAYCACRTEGCTLHIRDDDRQVRAQPWRCGGPVVLAVVGDREGRWWQVMECCSRCAAATPGAKTLTTAVVDARPARVPAPEGGPTAAPAGTPHFSDRCSAVVGSREVPAPRPAPARQRRPLGKIAQRVIPHDLRPDALREELVELGDLFRAYQQRTQPDLAMLADLHERKASAFKAWADVTCDNGLRREAQRAAPPLPASSTSSVPAARAMTGRRWPGS